jgi:STE24 endopeptidase
MRSYSQPEQGPAAEASRYQRLLRRVSVADMLLAAGLMALLLVTDWTSDIRNFAVRVAGGYRHALALFVYTALLLLIVRVLTLGLDYYLFLIEHRFHLSNQKLRGWAWDQCKGFIISLVLGELLAQAVYFLIRWQPHWWWVSCWLLFLLFSVLLAHLAPVVLFPLFFRFRALEDDELAARLLRLSERAGTRVRGVYEWKLSAKSRKANAAVMGLGRTRRIVISDTLLGICDHDEIEAVLAHELGHHVYRHMLKAILMQGAVSFLCFWCLKLAVRWAELDWQRFEQIDFANMPLMVLVASAVSVAVVPLLNAYSRWNERSADRYAWKTLGEVGPFCTAMEKLADQNLSEREPAWLVEKLFHSHPPVGRRIRAALAWAERRG